MASTNCSANNLHEDIQTTREKHGRSVYWSQRRWSGGACPCPSRPHPMGDWGERHDACCLLIDPRKLQSEIRFFFFPAQNQSRSGFCVRPGLAVTGLRTAPDGRARRDMATSASAPPLDPPLGARARATADGDIRHTWFLRGYLASAGGIASPVRTAYVDRGVVGRGRAYAYGGVLLLPHRIPQRYESWSLRVPPCALRTGGRSGRRATCGEFAGKRVIGWRGYGWMDVDPPIPIHHFLPLVLFLRVLYVYT